MPKPFGPFGAGLPHARTAPRMKSFCAPCLPKKKGLSSSTNHWSRPSTLPEFDPADEPPPYLPPHQPSPSPSSNSPTDPKTSPDSPLTLLLHLPDSPSPLPSSPATWSRTQHASPERGGGTRGPHSSPCAIFIVRHEPDRRKVGIIS